MMPEAQRKALVAAAGDAVRFDAPAARLTSLRVGGPADALARPDSRETLLALLRACRAADLPSRVLGNGFNTVVRDGGVDGLLIQLRMRELDHEAAGGLRADAGASHHRVTRFCTEHGLSGLEFAAAIPGTVGGWVAMNAGIPEREMRDVVVGIEIADPDADAIRWLPGEALGWRYRGLEGLPEGAVVTAARFAVREETREQVAAEVERNLAKRRDRQPQGQPSCGSVFVNPPGDFAGRLIEAAGLKGAAVGGAEISRTHANFIVNRGGASARDVLDLIERARSEVQRSSGIALETEVKIVGREAR